MRPGGGISGVTSCVALAALGLAACATGPSDQLAELQRQREQWAAQGISTYVFTVRRSCFCGGPLHVEIKVGQVAIVRTDLDTGLPVPAELASLYPDVPGLFAIVQREIELPAAELAVSYDAARGFPARIAVDPIENAVDDEYVYTITGFRTGS
jgi:hypothetical protein